MGTNKSMDSDEKLYTAEEIYSSVSEEYPWKKVTELIFQMQNWYINICDYDSKTGHPIPIGMNTLLSKINKFISLSDYTEVYKDRLSRIIDHSYEALKSIIINPKEKVIREYAVLPVHAAKEIDSNCIQWLSRKPGPTLRGKLADKPYVKAVHRRMSLDSSENRLLKSFILRLEALIIARCQALPKYTFEKENELLTIFQRWFQNDETSEIGPWANLPPNNTLLQDKNYRKIWDSWLWLQSLDANLNEDFKHLGEDFLTVLFWTLVSSLENIEQIRLLQQPNYFDFESINIYTQIRLQGIYCPAANSLKDSDIKKFYSIYLEHEKKDGIRIQMGPLTVLINNKTEKTLELKVVKNKIIESKYKYCYEFSNIGIIIEKIKSLLFHNSTAKSNATEIPHDLDELYSEVILDIYSISPRFITDSNHEKRIPLRLVNQYWESFENGQISIDCNTAKAIALFEDVTTISMLDLFSESRSCSSNMLNNAAMSFVQTLYSHIPAKSLIYLVPDSINDFELESIRRSINYYFPKNAPLPNSIAAVFAWQSSDSFGMSSFKDGDIVLVIENGNERASITPLIGKYDNEMEELIPESYGIIWERHPSEIISVKSPASITKMILEKDNCPFSNQLAEQFGANGLRRESEELSFFGDNQSWYNLPSNFRHQLDQEIEKISINAGEISRIINNIPEKRAESRIFVLPIGNKIKAQKEECTFKWLPKPKSLTKGGQTLSNWQKVAAGTPLWKDHLPELSIKVYDIEKGYYTNFELVKDKTVIPQKNSQLIFKIDKEFTLPKPSNNQKYYEFPLAQGSAGKELHYTAYLQSKAFPLKKDTKCNLIMKYTYGADDPYELIFVPRNPGEAGFNSVKVEWREFRQTEIFESPIPGFPKPYEWKELRTIPKKNSSETSDLLEWVSETLSFFPNYIEFIKNKSLRDDTAGKLRARISFAVPTIWSQGRTLIDEEAPSEFKESVSQGIDNALFLMEQNDTPKSLYDVLFFFLSCLHSDMPEEIILKLFSVLENSKDYKQLQKYHVNIALAIGEAKNEWQIYLLELVLDCIKSENNIVSNWGIRILSVALWRAEKLIFLLEYKNMLLILNKLLKIMKFSNEELDISAKQNSIKPYQLTASVRYLELLLALLRARGAQDRKIKEILSSDGKILKEFITIIDDLTKIICDEDIKINSRIGLKFEKPVAFRNTPDLLYALRMFLTGDSGANSIIIAEVTEED